MYCFQSDRDCCALSAENMYILIYILQKISLLVEPRNFKFNNNEFTPTNVTILLNKNNNNLGLWLSMTFDWAVSFLHRDTKLAIYTCLLQTFKLLFEYLTEWSRKQVDNTAELWYTHNNYQIQLLYWRQNYK